MSKSWRYSPAAVIFLKASQVLPAMELNTCTFSALILFVGSQERHQGCKNLYQLECGPMPNMTAAQSNIGGNLCWMLLIKFGSPPLSNVGAVTKPRCETHWHMLGCPKLANQSQPLMGGSSPHCEDMWSRYCCLTSFFWIADICLNCENIAWQIVQWCADSEFLHPVFSVSHVQHIWDLNSKFALRPHHVWKYVDIQLRPLRTGEEKKRMKEKKKQQRQNIMACSVGRP